MTTISIILKILPYLLSAGIPSFFFIRAMVRKNRSHKNDLEEKNKTIKSLRDQIVEMALLEGEKKDVDNQGKNIKKGIANSNDIDTAYADRLPDMPRKSRK